MNCPRCSAALVQARSGAVVVDACPVCHGAFYEHGEASKGLDPDAELRALLSAGTATLKSKTGLLCPRGHGPLTAYVCRSPDVHRAASVEIDTCNQCRGIWLDNGEAQTLKQIAGQSGDTKSGLGWHLLQLFSGIPLEVYHPVQRRPVMVWLLIAACVGMFGYELFLASRNQLEWAIQNWGLVPNDLIHGRHLGSIVSHMFMHGGFGHIFGNLVYLYVFGDNIEDKIGRIKFLVLYFVCGLFAALGQFLSAIHSTIPMVGASGAIAGILGAYLVLFPRVRIYATLLVFRFKVSAWLYLGFWIATNLLMGSAAALDGAESAHGTAWWAHIGGFAAGALWALVMRRRVLASPVPAPGPA